MLPAVSENVGTFKNQTKFTSECARIARKAVFLTTPNRWFPVEFHTVLPLEHWFPKPIFRNLMRRTGCHFFAEEANLNLMTTTELGNAARAALSAYQFEYRVSHVRLCGWRSNLLLIGARDTPGHCFASGRIRTRPGSTTVKCPAQSVRS